MCVLSVQYLSSCVVGASLEEVEEEEDAQSVDSSFVPGPKEGCYEIVGTVKDKDQQKPSFVKELVQVINQFQRT